MHAEDTRRYARDLAVLLDDLAEVHGRILSVTRAKIDAMRRADVEALAELGQRAHTLIGQVRQREGLRRQLADRLAVSMDMPPGSGRSLSCGQWVARLGDAEGCRLREAAARLRHVMVQLATANRMAAALSRGVLGHFRAIFASIAADSGVPLLYSRCGAPLRTETNQIIEITG